MVIFSWIICIFGLIMALIGFICLCYTLWEVIEIYRSDRIYKFLHITLRCRKNYEYAYKVMRRKIFICHRELLVRESC